ncbi:MAG: phosphoglycerate dehydrogenase [Candidatus Omnitrophica bacterium]|nr:phosphoglycerate dehydrogenase [Candidatus Omnitrophota bacterium]
MTEVKTGKFKVLVSDNLEASGIGILEKEKQIQLDVKTGLPADQLKKIIGEYDAMIVRSATHVSADLIEKAKRLKVIGRAGVGVDNVDVPAATKRGIIVMNTPEGNSISTAEHTVSLMLALNRNIVQAHNSLQRGEWKRSQFTGSELFGKTLGVVGFGRIGREVAKRALGFGMKIIAFDPYLSVEAVKQPEIQVVQDLTKVLKIADYITVHTPLNDDTYHLLDDRAFQIMKKGVRIVNCARGGIIDEEALVRAIQEKKVRGAALDVYEKEPPDTKAALFSMPEVITSPHLGASTEEAQENVAVAVANQVVDALLNRSIRNAVNLPSLDGETYAVLRPWLSLAEKMGLLHTQLFEGNMTELEVKYSGDLTRFALAPLTISVLKGLLTPVCGEVVNFVNAPSLAKERGITVNESKTTQVEDFVNAISVSVKTSKGTNTLLGSLFGNNDLRIVRINEFYVEVIPKGFMLVITNQDKPGVVGAVGTLLGKHRINIAEMTLGRKKEGTYALTVINTDNAIPAEVLRELRALKHIVDAKVVKL